ncbi:MAG: hypothetical protein C4519_15170 [Desulfobacteraceae bacterium]|nr:MAG: hypothetical protein C4519_15170 [Desulfobacteraceae bacterium]
MFSIQRKTAVLGLICIIVFASGLARLFWLRFEAGDLYPPYSSLRGDPLGTQVLYEGLQSIDGSGATRNFRPLDQVDMAAGSTFVVCGLKGGEGFLAAGMWQALLARISNQGGRLFIAFMPGSGKEKSPAGGGRTGHASANASSDSLPQGPDDNRAPVSRSKPETGPPFDSGPQRSEWSGVMAELGLTLLKANTGEHAFADGARRSVAAAGLPEWIPWRAPHFFAADDAAWQSIYTWEDRPVIVWRSWGRGSVVMSADSYLLSNEALRRHRQAAFLTWLFRLPDRVIVDEYHHGLVDRPGIAGLMRKYRLQGFAAGLVVLVILWVWRQAAVFVPRPLDHRPKEDEQGIGRSVEGWISLMRQHIGPQDLLRTCYQAWRTSPATARLAQERIARVGHLVEYCGADARRHTPISVYKTICEMLAKGNPS